MTPTETHDRTIARVLRPAPDAAPPLETALWALGQRLWPVALHEPGVSIGDRVATGKEPVRNRWGDVAPTRESLAYDYAGHPDRGVGIRVGPSGGVGDVEGDGPRWRDQLDALCGGSPPESLGWPSRRGGHVLTLPCPPELAHIPSGTKFPWAPEFCDLEIRLNGKDAQSQSVIPPTVTDDFPRRWEGPWRIAPLPDDAIATLAKLWEEDRRRKRSASQQGQRGRARCRRDGESTLSTIDAFNADQGVDGILAMLAQQGWRQVKRSADGVVYVAHPEATGPWSASVGWCGPRLFCWSNNTAFPVQKPLDAFDIYRILEHGDDFRRALVALRERGYGMPRRDGRRATPGDAPPPQAEPRGPSDGGTDATPAGAAGEGQQPFTLTDLGNCDRFVRDHGDCILHVGAWKKWLVWDEARWQPDETGAVVRLAKRTVRGIAAEAAFEPDSDRFKALSGWAHKSEDARRIVNMVRLAESEDRVAISHRRLNSDPWLLNAANGTVDLKSGTLRPHDRRDLITHLAPAPFDPDATCPLWLEELEIVFAGDASLIAFFQRLCGYWLTGVVREQVLPIAYGSGRNGKSTVIGTMLRILGGDYSYEADPGLIMQRASEDHPTEKASLFGKRMVALSETDSGRRLNEALVKRLTGKEQITARRMREDPWSFWPTHKLILATNHRPEIRGTDVAIWRRVLLIPFTVTIPPEQEITDFADRLAAEDPGILAWCVRGCLAWQEIGLNPPESIKAATEAYRGSQDVLANFIAERCLASSQLKTRAGDVYSAYCQWAKDNGEGTLGSRTFYDAMADRGFPIKPGKANRRYMQGIGLRQESAESEEG